MRLELECRQIGGLGSAQVATSTMDLAKEELQSPRVRHQRDLPLDTLDGHVRPLFGKRDRGQLHQRINVAGSKSQRRLKLFLGLRVPSLRPESDSEEMRPTRVLGRQGYDPAVSLSRLDGVPFGKVGGAQLHVRPDFVRLLREELLQGLDRRLVGPGLNVQL